MYEWGEASGYGGLPMHCQDIGCSPGLVKLALECLRLPSAKQFFFASGATLSPEFAARARQLIIKASCVHEDQHDYSFERNFLLAPVVCPELGILEWMIKSRRGRKTLKTIQKTANKPPYDLLQGCDTMMTFDESEAEEESVDDEEDEDCEDDSRDCSDGERKEGRAEEGQLKRHDLSKTSKDMEEKEKELSAVPQTKAVASKPGVELDEEQENEAELQRKLVNILDKATERGRLSTDQTRADQGNKRRRSLSPLRFPETKKRERLVLPPNKDLDHPFYKENAKEDWSYSRIRQAQRKIPGTCRKPPGECSPRIGADGRYRVCRFAHPWLLQHGDNLY